MEATDRQIKFLNDLGVFYDKNISKEEAIILIQKHVEAIPEQLRVLKLFGYRISKISEYDAIQLIEKSVNNEELYLATYNRIGPRQKKNLEHFYKHYKVKC
ncbi:MAG: hypothetical protein WC879_03595 [Melioribacteraceae bacterium]